jgi:hypothetical protein
MKSAIRLVVAFLMGVVFYGCDGSSPTSPSTTVTPPVNPTPTGPVQIGVIRGFELSPFVPGVSFGGAGTLFKKTTDGVIDFRVELGVPGDYRVAVIIQSHNTGDSQNPPKVLTATILEFTGSSTNVTLQYDSSQCYQGQCFVAISNRSDRLIERNNGNMAWVYGKPEI